MIAEIVGGTVAVLVAMGGVACCLEAVLDPPELWET